MVKPLTPPTLEELQEQIGEDLCEYCPFMNGDIPHKADALCEGSYCEDARMEFLESEGRLGRAMTSTKHSEKTLERQLRDTVSRKGGLCLKLLPFQFTGLPDRLVLLPRGRVLFCETKSTGDTLSPRQKLVHGKLRDLGFDVLLINEPNKINEI